MLVKYFFVYEIQVLAEQEIINLIYESLYYNDESLILMSVCLQAENTGHQNNMSIR